MANKHSDQLDNIFKDIRQLQNDGAKVTTGNWNNYNGCTQSLKYNHQKLTPSPFKSTDLNLDMNPGKVPDVTKQSQ